MNPTAVTQNRKDQLLFVKNRLVADSTTRELPTRLQIIKAGVWTNSWKGDLEITVTDLQEMKLNFDKGIGLPDNGSEGAPVDYKHEDWDKAAFWIKALEVDETTGILWASEIEWTPAGREAVLSGEFKFFSPSVYPACLGTWQDPEDPTHTAQNVLLGGGLTNIPFFKGLTGLKASQTPQGDGRENVIYIAEEGEDMDLATLRTTKKEDLTAEQIEFLKDNKAELTAEEQINLGLAEAETQTPVVPSATITPTEQTTAPNAEAVALQASIKAGTHVVVPAAEHAALKASAEQSAAKLADMEKKEVAARVDAHVKRGAIKQDQAEKWTGLILADASNEDLLVSLPENKLIASEIGGNGSAVSAVDQLKAAAIKTVTDSEGKVEFSTALNQARKENPTLAEQADAEIAGK